MELIDLLIQANSKLVEISGFDFLVQVNFDCDL